jgi:hypothetical protein
MADLFPTHLNKLVRNFKDVRKKKKRESWLLQMVKYVVTDVTLEEEMGGDRRDSWGRNGWVAGVIGEEGRGSVGWWESDSEESGWEAEEGGLSLGKKKKENPRKLLLL